MYWPKVKLWAMEWGVELTKVDLSDKFIDGVQSVPTMDVIVDGELKLRVTSWGSGAGRLDGDPPPETAVGTQDPLPGLETSPPCQ